MATNAATGVARNVERSTLLAERLETAGSLWAKFKGLMGRRSLPPGDGLWLPASNGIHMMFMRFPIDAVFVTKADACRRPARAIRAPVAGRVDGPRAADPGRRRRPGAAGRDDRGERAPPSGIGWRSSRARRVRSLPRPRRSLLAG